MHHSIIVRIFKRIFKFIEKNYRFSLARKVIINISNILKNYFENSFIYKLFVGKNYNSPKFLQSSVIGRSEGLLEKILSFLSQLYRKGIGGSFILKLDEKIKGAGAGFYSLIIIGAVLTYNFLTFINNRMYVLQIYVSLIIIFFTINFYFIATNNLYKNSIIKKIVDGIFHDAAKE